MALKTPLLNINEQPKMGKSVVQWSMDKLCLEMGKRNQQAQLLPHRYTMNELWIQYVAGRN